MTGYINGIKLFGVDMRVNKSRIMELVGCGEAVVAKANELIRAIGYDKAKATDLILKFKEDMTFALDDDFFYKDDVVMVLDTLNKLEKRI